MVTAYAKQGETLSVKNIGQNTKLGLVPALPCEIHLKLFFWTQGLQCVCRVLLPEICVSGQNPY